MLQFVLLMAFVDVLDLDPVSASSLAYVISAQYNYLLNYTFTFESRRGHRSALPRFLIVSTIGLGLNAMVVWLSHDLIGLHYLAAQVLATLTTLAWNYASSLRWAFASPK